MEHNKQKLSQFPHDNFMSQKRLAVVIIIASFVLSILFFVYKDLFIHARTLGLIGLFFIQFVSSASFFVSGPAFLTVIAGGALYNPLLVAVIASSGSALGDMLGYAFGYSGRALTQEKLEQKIWFRVLERYFARYGSILLFVLAFLPNPFFDSIGIIAGIFGFSPARFLTIVFVGRFLRYGILADVGKMLG